MLHLIIPLLTVFKQQTRELRIITRLHRVAEVEGHCAGSLLYKDFEVIIQHFTFFLLLGVYSLRKPHVREMLRPPSS